MKKLLHFFLALLPLPLLPLAAQEAADVRSIGYRGAAAQEQLASDAAEVETRLQNLLAELQRSGLRDAETVAAIREARQQLAEVQAQELSRAASTLREVSTGEAGARLKQAVAYQQDAEVKLRKTSADIGASAGGLDLLIAARVLRSRVALAALAAQRQPDWAWLIGEHEALSLQTDDLLSEITSRATAEGAADKEILLAALESAKASKLKDFAAAAKKIAAGSEAKPLITMQGRLRTGYSALVAILQRLTPLPDRLAAAKERIDQLAAQQKKLNGTETTRFAQESSAIETEAVKEDLEGLSAAAAADLGKAQAAMAAKMSGQAGAGAQAVAALESASASLDRQIAAAEAQAGQSLADAARQLAAMQAQAQALAQAEQGIAQNPEAAPAGLQEKIAQQTAALQEQAAGIAPDAANALGAAAASMAAAQPADAAQKLADAASALGAQAAAAAAAAQQDAAIAAQQAALDAAAAAAAQAAQTMSAGETGKAVGQTLQNAQQFGQMAQTAQTTAQQTPPGTGQSAAAAAAAAMGSAATSSQQAGQQASLGNTEAAQGSAQGAAQVLAQASGKLKEMRQQLRDLNGMGTSMTYGGKASPMATYSATGGRSEDGGGLTHVKETGPDAPDAGYNEKGGSGGDRQQILQFSKTAVPAEYSAMVDSYYRKLAAPVR